MMENVILHALLSLSYTERGSVPRVVSPGEACFDPFGCFSIESPWSGTTERPVAALPMPLNVTTPVFCLYTPSEPSCHELSLQNIGDLYTSSFDRNAPLYVITHGYMETAAFKWMVEMREALLKLPPPVGVITVDWSTAAHPPYAQAVANIRLAGAVTGYLLHLLVEFYDVPLSNIHLVGHSLGAHFMSYAGDFLKTTAGKKVKRITGLDPAGPYFMHTPPKVRLDPSDAEFVDVIHTDIPKELWEINKLGHPDPLGHVDYYPNGGYDQAGCLRSAHATIEKDKSIADGVLSYVGCNHQRSHAFFTESVTSKCEFLGVMCNSWEEFLKGSCWGCSNGHCSTMGLHATPLRVHHHPTARGRMHRRKVNYKKIEASGGVSSKAAQVTNKRERTSSPQASSTPAVKIFLGTNSNAPFCAEQYRVTIFTSNSVPSQSSGGDVARFTFKLRGQSGEQVIHPSEKPVFIEPGGNYSWIGFSSQLGALNALQVDYEEDQGLLHALIWRFSAPTLFIDSFTVDELSTGSTFSFKFCGSKMEAGDSHVLFPDTLCKEGIPDNMAPVVV